jgi:hypothetical protein
MPNEEAVSTHIFMEFDIQGQFSAPAASYPIGSQGLLPRE